MYKVLRNILFLFDAEKVHYFSMNLLKWFCKISLFRNLINNYFSPSGNHSIDIFGICFKNRVGLAAGFDKNAKYLNELEALGFGFVEIGTVTPLPQPGNNKPRLFRFPKDKALLNRMGFNNDGIEIVCKRLENWRNTNKSDKKNKLVIGGNIGKNKITENENAWKDYKICFERLYPLVDYFALNVSSPNTPGLRALQGKEALRKILTPILIKKEKEEIKKPLFLKISPDLTNDELNDIIDITLELKLEGLIISNTTLSRQDMVTSQREINNQGTGGISGKPLQFFSDEMIRYVNKKSGGQVKVIGSGGIFTGQDALQKVIAGSELVQVWTGFIYEGPGIVKNICRVLKKGFIN